MVSAPPVRIVTDRLVVRRETAADAAVIAEAIDRNRARLLPWLGWATEDAADRSAQIVRIAESRKLWEAGEMYDYGIFGRSTAAFLGKIALHRRVGPGGIEIGYWLDGAAEGDGVISEATAALTQQALNLTDVDRVEIHCDAANSRSRSVPQRLGFVLDRIEPRAVAAAAETGDHMIWVYQPDRR
ncbi:GNAT family N-acetyltransferase [Rhodococcus sp. IEGM 1354]|uniref:GNAT family N-acetyltransferase n=1 Tax=Rhodococcus sp. IEGM 1354 TaxID=3047088 RepID=UPI0024B679C5|nr:GNAT family N-acetyltransferase [Rhodococcus sp. IEGM 1354]MDI9928908.1 GNAT family N-acetyltransferase [Rhodococcus sp. IEGM 1354]